SYAAVAGAPQTVFGLQPEAMTFLHEPSAVGSELESWWQRVTEAHERSNIGNLVRPADLFVEPQELLTRIQGLPGADLEQLGLAAASGEDVGFQSQPTRRFHGSMPAMAEEIRKLAAARPKSRRSAFLSDFRDLAVGDYVVHVEHGIGQYLGLKEIAQGEGEPATEFMLLEYAEGAKLYVPLTRLDLVQKYRSAEGTKPALSHLGTAAWAKTKARVKKAMKDMADELLKLYAARRMAEGF